MTKFLNISTDNTLGGASPSDEVVSSQKAIKDYIDNNPVAYDNKSITMNGSSQLQASGVIDQADTTKAVKVWTGTLDEYNSLTPDNNTIYNITDDEITTNAANTDLSNLTSIGKNISNWSSNVSNCITYIPQDIKLELSNGTLTLKAGSKVYVPNGTGVFDIVTISSDITYSSTASDTNERLVYLVDGTALAVFGGNSSGTVAPSGSGNNVFYNTSSNTVRLYQNGVQQNRVYSFPIAKVKADGTYQIGNIQQIFNGFGYIGSVIFTLPGIKGLIPNGRNEDGTLKSIEYTLTETRVTDTVDTYWCDFAIATTGNTSVVNYTYDEDKNVLLDGSMVLNDRIVVLNYSRLSGVIKLFKPKTAFHSLDYSDNKTISGWGKPSGTIETLTLGASGTTYTAPANGYFNIYGTVTAGNGYVQGACNSYNQGMQNATNTGSCWINVPVKKSGVFTLKYSNFSVVNFYFIKAEGEVV